MKIDARLAECAKKAKKGGFACDVGTDHAYLPVYLISEGISERAIACDLNKGPLEFAAQTVLKYQLQDKITLIQSDGLDNVPPDGITDVIFAGMGAELICRLISKAEWLKNGVNLILQPMTRIPTLRRWLYKNGYEITSETAVESEGFCYTVISAGYCGKALEIDETFAHVGKLDFTKEPEQLFGKKLAERLMTEAEGMLRSNPDSQKGKEIKSLAKEIDKLAKGAKS